VGTKPGLDGRKINNTTGYLKLKKIKYLKAPLSNLAILCITRLRFPFKKTLDGNTVAFLLQQKLQIIHVQKGVSLPLMTGNGFSYLRLSEFCHRNVTTSPSEIHCMWST